jgi:hypothetical protein
MNKTQGLYKIKFLISGAPEKPRYPKLEAYPKYGDFTLGFCCILVPTTPRHIKKSAVLIIFSLII